MDKMIRATAANAQVRAFACVSRDTVDEARIRHGLSPVACATLGRLMSGGVMMGAMLKGDAAIAMISVGALALGYMLMNIASQSGNKRTSSNVTADVCSTLFGSTSILTLSISDVWICVGMSVIVVTVFLIFYNKIFAVTFDENFAKATGVRSDMYNLLIAVVIAVIIVIAMNFVGSLLISALIIFPALSAMRVFKSFRSVIICSVIISLFCAASGILISILAGTPVGSTIVSADICVFFVFCLASFVLKKGK